jgi:hypothetical protein
MVEVGARRKRADTAERLAGGVADGPLEPRSSKGEGGKLCHRSHLLRRRDVNEYACRR